jgi:hypothetical protein
MPATNLRIGIESLAITPHRGPGIYVSQTQ